MRVLMTVMVLLLSAPMAQAAVGDASILAPFPSDPGFPEGIAVRDGKVFAAGAATFGTTAAGPSAVVVYDRASGAQLARHDVVGEDLMAEHANSSIAFDAAGRLYVLNTQLGIYRLDPETGEQTPYSTPFADLPRCVPLQLNTPCAPTLADTPPIPNDIAFAENGTAYVTDSMQATIWRVPPGGGTPQIFFQDRRLASPYIGANGLRLDPAGKRLYLTVSIDQLGRASVYSLPLHNPAPYALTLFHRFGTGELPDGIAFGAGGDLYVSMASPIGSGLLVLGPNGTQKARYTGDVFDGPANLAFDGAGNALMTNHAPVSGLLLRQFSIVDVEVADSGWPLITPAIP